MTVDRFASYNNSKCYRFNAKYLCPSTEAVNTFSQDWSNETNWLVPPIYLLLKCLTQFALSTSGTTGILSCLVRHQLHSGLCYLKNKIDLSIIQDVLYLPSTMLEQRDYEGSFIGLKNFDAQVKCSYDLLKGYYQTNNFRLTRKYSVVLLILLTW